MGCARALLLHTAPPCVRTRTPLPCDRNHHQNSHWTKRELPRERTSHVRPWLFIMRGDMAASAGMGMSTVWLFTSPTVKPVKPAIVPCTAPCPKSAQSYESCEFAGTERT